MLFAFLLLPCALGLVVPRDDGQSRYQTSCHLALHATEPLKTRALTFSSGRTTVFLSGDGRLVTYETRDYVDFQASSCDIQHIVPGSNPDPGHSANCGVGGKDDRDLHRRDDDDGKTREDGDDEDEDDDEGEEDEDEDEGEEDEVEDEGEKGGGGGGNERGGEDGPRFCVYDTNTTGFGDNYLIGTRINNVDYIATLDCDTGKGLVEQCGNCIDAPVSGDTSTSWDSGRSRWVSTCKDKDNKRKFITSPDLKSWTFQDWEFDWLEDIVDFFPITRYDSQRGDEGGKGGDDDDDKDKDKGKDGKGGDDDEGERKGKNKNKKKVITWVVIWKVYFGGDKTKYTLNYGTFGLDDKDRKFTDKGVFDYSEDSDGFAVIGGKDTKKGRHCLITKRSGFERFGAQFNRYISSRRLTYKGGVLRQHPVVSSLVNTGKKYNKGNGVFISGQDVFTGQKGSTVYRIQTELQLKEKKFAFNIFSNPKDGSQCGSSLSFENDIIRLKRNKNSKNDPAEAKVECKYKRSSKTKVDFVVDSILVEFFVNGGQHCGSTFALPDPTWVGCHVVAEEEVNYKKLVYTSYSGQDCDV